MRLIIQPDYARISMWAANYVALKILEFQPTPERPFILGLPTGSSPLGMYRHLVDLHTQKVISFENVITFNMDEYIGLSRDHPQSYYSFMWSNFFSNINIKPENVHIPDGMTTDLNAECEAYETKIRDLGGVHLFIGGVGQDGHLAFNEPGSSLASRTRIKLLNKDTIIANSRFFNFDINAVPQKAITVGVGTLLEAHEVMVMVSGHAKARALRHAVEGAISHQWTITALQMHPRSIIVCDEESIAELRVGTYRYYMEKEKDYLNPESLLPNRKKGE